MGGYPHVGCHLTSPTEIHYVHRAQEKVEGFLCFMMLRSRVLSAFLLWLELEITNIKANNVLALAC
jgi:hypothetical protein